MTAPPLHLDGHVVTRFTAATGYVSEAIIISRATKARGGA
jgi:hypothetical protein